MDRPNQTELPLPLDRDGALSLPEQIAASLRQSIDGAAMLPREALPSTRVLAQRLGVARGTVVAAYEQLLAEGYLAAKRGGGTIVHPELHRVRGGLGAEAATPSPAPAPGRSRVAPEAQPAPRPGPLSPHRPPGDAIDSPAWRSSWRTAAARAQAPAPVTGDPRLRAEIADHLRRMRGVSRDPDELLVTAGAREGLALLMTALGASRGNRLVVGVEDPGYPSLRGVAQRLGAEIVALPVDADGLITDRLPEAVLDLVIVTPSHQYPAGGSLPIGRRIELLAWAKRTGVVVVEDDYDAELRYVGAPLPALAALDDPEAGVVVTLGTFSKTVTPAIATGSLLAPARLRGLLLPVRAQLGCPVSSLGQDALAGFLASGELRRHTARLRRRVASRRLLLASALDGLPGVRLSAMSGGLQAVVELEAGPGSAERLAGVLAAGLGAEALAAYWHGRSAPGGPGGLVLGYGGPEEPEYLRALAELRRRLS